MLKHSSSWRVREKVRKDRNMCHPLQILIIWPMTKAFYFKGGMKHVPSPTLRFGGMHLPGVDVYGNRAKTSVQK